MAKCGNCKKYEDCRTGSGLTWPCGGYRPVTISSADRIRAMSDEKLERLYALHQAQQDGRLLELPCKVGDVVYTIKEDYFDCENCEHGSKAKYDPLLKVTACNGPNARHCPYSIEEHMVEGYNIGSNGISGPGEWGYEGLEHFVGVDGKWYRTRAEAEAAMAKENRPG